MTKDRATHREWFLALASSGILMIGLAARAGSFLVVDAPIRSDVILVLAGETVQRPERSLQLLAQGYGRRIVLDVPQPASITICPIEGLSTKDESKDAKQCLMGESGKSVLLVTSDFHTRRALSVFQREVPGYSYSVAAARDGEQFGVRWWTHRQWAKTLVDEWLRLIWWKVVDQWGKAPVAAELR